MSMKPSHNIKLGVQTLTVQMHLVPGLVGKCNTSLMRSSKLGWNLPFDNYYFFIDVAINAPKQNPTDLTRRIGDCKAINFLGNLAQNNYKFTP